MEGRFMGENIRLMLYNLEGIALFIDFEKAFDSLEWDFLRKTLDTFQFGHEFKSWVKILYTNITSCTLITVMLQIGLNYIVVSDKVVPCQGYCLS